MLAEWISALGVHCFISNGSCIELCLTVKLFTAQGIDFHCVYFLFVLIFVCWFASQLYKICIGYVYRSNIALTSYLDLSNATHQKRENDLEGEKRAWVRVRTFLFSLITLLHPFYLSNLRECHSNHNTPSGIAVPFLKKLKWPREQTQMESGHWIRKHLATVCPLSTLIKSCQTCCPAHCTWKWCTWRLLCLLQDACLETPQTHKSMCYI